MTDKKKINLKSISTFRKIVTVTFLMTFAFWGMFSAATTIAKVNNYLHPYYFVFLFGTVGLVVGIMTSIKLKYILTVTKTQYYFYGGTTLITSVGFLGTFLYFGHHLNQNISTVEKCDNYQLLDKYYYEGGRNKGITQVDLYVDLNGKTEKLKCNKPYFDKVEVGDSINICKFSSIIGFDYYKLTNQQDIIFNTFKRIK
jgi:hypothetical protein